MKPFLRTFLWLSLIVWLGGLLFFPVTAWAAFSTIADTHAAGTIVARCLAVLHHEGLVAGCLIVLLLAIGRGTRAFTNWSMTGIVITLIMLALTAFSQFWIIPKMERDRIAAGGAIDNVPKSDARHADFDLLHNTSEHLEEAVIFGGVLLVVLLSKEA